MQFIKNGPNVPAELLESHEEGRVVFFCGAGISCPAGLPMFCGLVSKIYKALEMSPSEVERTAQETNRFDTVLGLLERRITGGRRTVREALARSLEPNYNKKGALQTHRAILTLGKTRDGPIRLVTTNFDRVFEKVIEKDKLSFDRFSAPLLPVPKNRWDGLVYLHGLLSKDASKTALNKLVVSSGDFGLAYLTERWASRFVSELFREYTVCFVGYGINDPILRYMVDALAADELMGENTKSAFAFGSYAKGCEQQVVSEWEAMNVVPILYKKTPSHVHLHRTLHAWASSYRDGVTGKQAIVSRYANLKPTGTTNQDDFVGRLMWALSDKTGLPAKRFADMDPVPSLDWLEPFENKLFGKKDLLRFGIEPNHSDDSELKFSFLNRPTPHGLSAWMRPIDSPGSLNRFDEVMKHLARWLARHVGDPKLFLWAVGKGGELHPAFWGKISDELEKLPPESPMSVVWNLLASGLTKKPHSHSTWFPLAEKLSKTGFTPTFRHELRQILSPAAVFDRPYKWPREGKGDEGSDIKDPKLSDLVRWEIELNADDPHQMVKELRNQRNWQCVLLNSLTDLTISLRDTMELMEILGGANPKEDLSYIHQPSISPHEQNRDLNDWTVLIELLRDSWLAVANIDKEAAIAEVRNWSNISYPVFRRLTFFAVSNRPNDFKKNEILDWLMSDDTYWLWTTHAQRESIQLIQVIAPTLGKKHRTRLLGALVDGPPTALFREGISDESLQLAMDNMRWLYLAKCRAAGAEFTAQAESLLLQLEKAHPSWKLTDDDRDEFPMWSSSGEEHRVVRTAPRDPQELRDWLKEFPDVDDLWESDDWQHVCEKNVNLAVDALSELASQEVWPIGRWRQALQVWGNKKDLSMEVRDAIFVNLIEMPDKEFKHNSHSVAWWLKSFAREIGSDVDCLFQIINKILKGHEDDAREYDDNDVVLHAINHPVGLAVEAALAWWFTQGLEDDQGVNERVRPILDHVTNPNFSGLRHGRVVLASSAITLYRVDQNWTSGRLLQYFDWEQQPRQAMGMWTSFLRSPRLHWPFLDALKENFLSLPEYWGEMEPHFKKRYLSFVTYAAMEPNGAFSESDFKTVFLTLSTESLAEVANTMFRAQQRASVQGRQHFENRIVPFFKSYWPKDAKKMTVEASEAFANLCSVSGDALPKALELLSDWLKPVSNANLMFHYLLKSKTPSRHPSSVLALLSLSIGEQRPLRSRKLDDVLKQLLKGDPALKHDPKYQALLIHSE